MMPSGAGAGQSKSNAGRLQTRVAGGIEGGKGCRLRVRKARRRDHHRGGIEAPTRNQIADRRIDAGRDTVIVGTQPDAPRRFN